jgi:hypothetical protein
LSLLTVLPFILGSLFSAKLFRSKDISFPINLFVIRFKNGEIKKAFPIPHNYPVDLVLLSIKKDIKPDDKLILSISQKGNIPPNGMIRVVGFDQGRKSNRIYKKDKIIEGVIYFRWPRPTENCDPNV